MFLTCHIIKILHSYRSAQPDVLRGAPRGSDVAKVLFY